MSIIGQAEAERILFSADPARARSFLIEGPKGVGKAMLARKFAVKLLGSEERVKSKSHPDLLIVEKRVDEKTGKTKSEIVIDDARQIGSFLSLTPAEAGNRVVIVDSADELNNQSANAILKVVEEPPKRAIIILLSHGGHVLPTIRSRCSTIRAGQLKPSQMEQILMNLIPDAKSEEVELLIKISEGSPGAAAEIYNSQGLEILAQLLTMVESFPKPDYPALSRFAEFIDKTPNGFEVFKTIFSWYLNDLAKTIAIKNLSQPNLDALLEAASDWHKDLQEAEIFNMDKKQLIVNCLLKIAECYR